MKRSNRVIEVENEPTPPARKRQKKESILKSKTLDLSLKKVENNEETDERKKQEKEILANLDLDLNIVVGKNKTPMDVNWYEMKPKFENIKLDEHITFQYKNGYHNVEWIMKSKISKANYSKYNKLLKKYEYLCNFHQMSLHHLSLMLERSAKCVSDATQCITMLYNIHKSIMTTISEHYYLTRNRESFNGSLIQLKFDESSKNGLRKDIALLDVSSLNNDNIKCIHSQIAIDCSKLEKEKTYKKVWQNNAFQLLSMKLKIAPTVLIRDFVKLKYGLSPPLARKFASWLANADLIKKIDSKKDEKEKKIENYFENFNPVWEFDATKLIDIQSLIERDFKAKIATHEISEMYLGLITDCIRGPNQSLAWQGWQVRMRYEAIHFSESCDNDKSKFGQKLREHYQQLSNILSHHGGGAVLEHTVIGKFRAIIAFINEKCQNEENESPIKLLSENDQRKKIGKLQAREIELFRQKHKNDKKFDNMTDDAILRHIQFRSPPTPDLLFNRPIIINGNFVNWIDAKNYFLSRSDILKHKKLEKQCEKYYNKFGSGALVCLGVAGEPKNFFKGVECLLLDASYWNLKSQ